MNPERPAYWLVYVPASTEDGAKEVTAIAPEVLPGERFCRDTHWLLAAADGYRVHHPAHRVAFMGAVTRWLDSSGVSWDALDVDLDEALRDLDQHAPALIVDATDLTIGVVANTALHMSVMYPDGHVEPIERHIEPVRAALVHVLERDWPAYIRSVVAQVSRSGPT